MKSKTKEIARLIDKWLGKRVELTHTANFTGEQGEVIEIDFNSTDPKAFFGYAIKTKLDSGIVVTSYKFEGLTLI